jgi:hypothetical protein
MKIKKFFKKYNVKEKPELARGNLMNQ